MKQEDSIKYKGRLLVFVLIVGGLLSVLAGGLAYRQLIENKAYREVVKIQNHRRILTPGPRGNLYDREGRILVANELKFSAVVFLSEAPVRRAFRQEYLELKRDLREAGDNSMSNDDLQLLARSNVIQSYLDGVNAILGKDEIVDTNTINRHFISNPLLPYPIIDNLSNEEFAILLESLPVESPVQVYVSTARHYPYESMAAHALGYVSSTLLESNDRLPGEDLMTFATKGSFGRNGVEKEYDAVLQGRTGTEIWVVDPSGFQVERSSQRYPQQGDDMTLALDIDLQQAGEKAFDDWEFQGALVALDLDSVEVLSMISKPDYNLNDTSPYISNETAAAINERGAWENKALRGLYPPGSPFKLVTTLACLKAGVIDIDTVINCPGYLMIGNYRKPCHNHSGHGDVTLATAIQKSCNVYFYTASLEATIDALSQEAIFLNLHRPTGIDLPFETTRMNIPTREWKKEKHGIPWYPGDTANTSMGQGYVLLTPLQMAALVGSIAKNQVLTQPSIVKQTPRMLIRRPAAKSLGIPDEVHDEILKGMEMVVNRGGTGFGATVKGVRVAGKTGTAEVRQKEGEIQLAWFVGFAPVDDPRLAIAVVVEGQELDVDFYGGTNAAPVAQRVFQAYFDKHPELVSQEEPAIASVSRP